MYTMNNKILVFILFIYFINIYNMTAKIHRNNKNAKIHFDALQQINHVSNNIKENILKNKIYYYKSIRHKSHRNKEIERIVKEAKSYLGTPYKYGGNSRMGIDCSSFISNIFETHNINLPRISYQQAQEGFPISQQHLQRGDLLFFSTNFMVKTKINHVGIVIDMKENNISFIHASSSHGVIISRIKDPYWHSRFIIARRIT